MDETETVTVSPSGGSSLATPSGGGDLITEKGRTSIADAVVAKIAGIATREVSGVHEMGKGALRAFSAMKGKLPGQSSTPPATQGVSVEVGERQAAIDLDFVVEYGVSIPDVAESVRENVTQRVEGMTGLEVTEVNCTVDDVFLGDEMQEQEEPRVQ